MSVNDNISKLDELIKSLEELEKKKAELDEKPTNAEYRMKRLADAGKCTRCPPHGGENPKTVQRSWKEQRDTQYKVKKKDDEEEGHGHKRDGEPMDAANKIEVLSKPPVSEAQRRAMHAAAAGKSTIGIPKKVGKEFANTDEGGKLPEKVKKTIDLFAMETLEKVDLSRVPTVHYRGGKVTRVDHSNGSVQAITKLLTEEMHHEKSEGDKHYFRHLYDKHHTAVVFTSGKKQKQETPMRRASDVKKTDEVSIEEMEKSGIKYHIHIDGHRITDEPMTIKEINNLYGGVKAVESSGHLLVPHSEEKDKAEKAEDKRIMPKHPPKTEGPTLNYAEFNKPSNQPKPGKIQSPSVPAAQARIQQHKRDNKLVPPKPPTAIETIREKQKVNKSEIFGAITTETLTKSMRSHHSDEHITEMLKAAYDLGKIHHNVVLEWQNFKTLNPSLVNILDDE